MLLDNYSNYIFLRILVSNKRVDYCKVFSNTSLLFLMVYIIYYYLVIKIHLD